MVRFIFFILCAALPYLAQAREMTPGEIQARQFQEPSSASKYYRKIPEEKISRERYDPYAEAEAEEKSDEHSGDDYYKTRLKEHEDNNWDKSDRKSLLDALKDLE